MHDYMEKWTRGGISDKFCWWAISTHSNFEVEEIIYQLPVQFIEEKYGPKL